jgi:hypothetical protein
MKIMHVLFNSRRTTQNLHTLNDHDISLFPLRTWQDTVILRTLAAKTKEATPIGAASICS